MSDLGHKEYESPPHPVEQKVRDTFGDYPLMTQLGISDVLITQKKNWQTLRKTSDDSTSNKAVIQSVVENGHAYKTNIVRDVPDRPLTPTEIQERQSLLEMLKPYDLNGTFGIRMDAPNTRFYLSLQDSPHVCHLMTELTQHLIRLHESGAIPFFQYKFDSTDENYQLRFDPNYRDKGASPILYVADKDVSVIQLYLDTLSQKYPDSFLTQKAPFKFSPHGEEFDIWHIAMEAEGISATGTPEQGMRKAVSDFLKGIGLTKEWIPLQSLDAPVVRDSWEKATRTVGRDPKRPWIVTDRPTPDLLLR